MIINVSKAKANLSKLIDMAYHGEDVIIAKNEIVEKPGSLFTVDEQDYDCDENASINKHK